MIFIAIPGILCIMVCNEINFYVSFYVASFLAFLKFTIMNLREFVPVSKVTMSEVVTVSFC